MSPDELRAAADQLTRYVGRIPGSPDDPDYLNAWDMAEAAVRLADVIEYAEPVAAMTFTLFGGPAPMHPHIGKVLAIARGDTTNHENRSE